MLDTLHARANDFWRTDVKKQPLFTSSNVRTAHERIRNEMAQKKDRHKKMLESELFNIKEKPAPVVAPPMRNLTGLSCKYCAPSNSVSTKFYVQIFIPSFVNVCLHANNHHLSSRYKLFYLQFIYCTTKIKIKEEIRKLSFIVCIRNCVYSFIIRKEK